mmetsp:Transcript_33025/g.105917  ORF Transcript_33025/g.105917 Transcript_33025/m.105917 type:complete len:226 (+) Transcript_33025:249-926(+)
MESDVAKPLAMLSACLCTTPMIKPPAATCSTTSHTRGVKPAKRPRCRTASASSQQTEQAPAAREARPSWTLRTATLTWAVRLTRASVQTPASPLSTAAEMTATTPRWGDRAEAVAEAAETEEAAAAGVRRRNDSKVERAAHDGRREGGAGAAAGAGWGGACCALVTSATPTNRTSSAPHRRGERRRPSRRTEKRAAVSSLSWYSTWYAAASRCAAARYSRLFCTR